jgi:hypothetical protein
MLFPFRINATTRITGAYQYQYHQCPVECGNDARAINAYTHDRLSCWRSRLAVPWLRPDPAMTSAILPVQIKALDFDHCLAIS